MSLGKKVAIVAIILGLVFSLGTSIVLHVTVMPAFGEIEVDAAETDRARITATSIADLRMLETFTKEYASWTETYRFSRGENPGFADDELHPDNWMAAEVNLMLLVDRSGVVRYDWMSHPIDGSELDTRAELPFDIDDPESQDLELLSAARGLVKTPTGLMQVVALPILDSASRGPAEGFLLVGKFYTDKRITEVARQMTADLTIYYDMSDKAPVEVRDTIARLMGGSEPYYLTFDDESVHLWDLITDIRGQTVGVLQMSTPRAVSALGKATIRYATLVIAIACAVFLLAALAFMHFRIVSPIKQLTGVMQRMRRTGELDAVPRDRRSDEIGMLGREFDELTSKLRAAHAELEEARDEAVAMSKAKSEFLARMSHEIRTPMNGVLGMTELLRNTQLSKEQDRFVGTIYDSGSTLLALINDILDFSKIEAGKLRMENLAVDLRRLVEEAADSFAEPASNKGIELITMVAAEAETHVVTDPTRLRQVLVNLMGNAIKFTETGEIVVRLDTENDGDCVKARFEVCDTGIGIREENQAAIFESFTQEDGTTTRVYGGTGLGLTISRQIVDLLGGELRLESKPGVGSTFYFTVPLEKDTEHDALPSETVTVAGKRILVVDDNPTNLEILENHLTSWRAEVTCANGAASALEILRSADEEFDLAILDWHMPEIDGLELARRIREERGLHQLRLMMLSSLANSLEDSDCDELCISTQITKPVRQGDLFNALLNILSESRDKPAPSRRAPTGERTLAGRVLLAEDNVVNQAVAVGMLQHMGLDVDVAVNGEVAAEKVASGGYDVVLMDCQMPVLDGFDATRRIREWEVESFERPVSIVALTANALKGDREKCLEAGMNDYLAKPFTAEELYSVLSLWIGREPGPDGAANEDVVDAEQRAAGS